MNNDIDFDMIGDKVKVSGLCKVTNKVVKRIITLQEYEDYYVNGKFAQDAFPNLTPGEREFFISGCSAEGFDSLFGESDESH